MLQACRVDEGQLRRGVERDAQVLESAGAVRRLRPRPVRMVLGRIARVLVLFLADVRLSVEHRPDRQTEGSDHREKQRGSAAAGGGHRHEGGAARLAGHPFSVRGVRRILLRRGRVIIPACRRCAHRPSPAASILAIRWSSGRR
jgi:hypothetical protein